MKDELKSKAPGMRFGIDVTEKPKPMPRVIHALGNFVFKNFYKTCLF